MDLNDPHRIARSHNLIEMLDPTPSMPIVCIFNLLVTGKGTASPDIHLLQSRGAAIRQSDHQAILRKHVEALGAKVELGTELVEFKEMEGKVHVTLRTTTSDQSAEETCSFEYLIGAD